MVFVCIAIWRSNRRSRVQQCAEWEIAATTRQRPHRRGKRRTLYTTIIFDSGCNCSHSLAAVVSCLQGTVAAATEGRILDLRFIAQELGTKVNSRLETVSHTCSITAILHISITRCQDKSCESAGLELLPVSAMLVGPSRKCLWRKLLPSGAQFTQLFIKHRTN